MTKVSMPREVMEFLKQKQGQTLLIKGRSGTGKTTFAFSLLDELIKTAPDTFSSQNFIYITSRVTSVNLCNQFPWATEILPQSNIVDATRSLIGATELTTKFEDTTTSLAVFSDELTFISAVNDQLIELENGVCVIDTFDAVLEAAQADGRRLAVALANLGRTLGAKIIIIVEGAEEDPLDHIVDGIISLSKNIDEGHIWRTIHLEKLRGTRIDQGQWGFTLGQNRFQVLQPYDVEQAHRLGEFTIIPHSGGRFSSGIEKLDEIFGGFRRGSTFFIEVGERVSNEVVNTLILNMIANFLLQEEGVVIVPPNKLSFRRLKAAALRYGFVDQLNSRLRLFASSTSSLGAMSGATDLGEPYYKTVDTRESSSLESAWNLVIEELRNQECSAILNIVGFGWLHSWLGPQDLPRWATRIAADTAAESNFAVIVGYSSTAGINRFLGDLADIHALIKVKEGATILRGVNPQTPQYSIFTKTEEGKTQVDFQEIT